MPGSPPAGFSTPGKQMADRLLTTNMLKTETEERARITAERHRALCEPISHRCGTCGSAAAVYSRLDPGGRQTTQGGSCTGSSRRSVARSVKRSS